MNFVSPMWLKQSWFGTLAGVGSIAILTACVQNLDINIKRFADKDALTVSDNTLKTVNRAFYAHFVMGDWRYKGANVANGEVKAYIKIPQQLSMPMHVQQQYLQQSICPKADKIEMWNKLKHVELSVHIYTSSKTKSVSAQCVNPWNQNA